MAEIDGVKLDSDESRVADKLLETVKLAKSLNIVINIRNSSTKDPSGYPLQDIAIYKLV